jgi:hypothetical protein
MLFVPIATVYVLTDAEGGQQDLFDGMHPSINFDGDLVASTIRSLDGKFRLERGAHHRIAIEVPYGDEIGLQALAIVGAKFQFHSGARVLARGEVLAAGEVQ